MKPRNGGAILLMAILLTLSGMAYGQSVPQPNTNPAPGVYVGQMLNLSNTFVGSRNDTTTDGTAKYFTVCKISTSTLLPVIYPLYLGAGTITFNVSGIKITGNPAGVVTLEQSFDGTNWAPVRTAPTIASVSTDTVGVIYTSTATYSYNAYDSYTIQDVAGTQSYSFPLTERSAAYYRIKVAPTGTQTSSWRAWYCFTRR